MVSKIPLFPGDVLLHKVNELWEIDPINGEILSRVSGCEVGFINDGRVFLTLNITNYPKKRIKKFKRAHLVWWKATGEWPKLELDHKNRDSTDDRFENLRESTSRDNSINIDRCDRELPTGVYYRSDMVKCYYVTMHIKGKQRYIGNFHTIDEAQEARRRALENVDKSY